MDKSISFPHFPRCTAPHSIVHENEVKTKNLFAIFFKSTRKVTFGGGKEKETGSERESGPETIRESYRPSVPFGKGTGFVRCFCGMFPPLSTSCGLMGKVTP